MYIAQIWIQPVTRGVFVFFGNHNLNHLSIFELIVKWYQPAVHLCSDTTMPQISVNTISEVNRSCALWQVFYLTLRCKHKYLVIKNICLNRFQKFFCPGKLSMPINQLTQPPKFFLKLPISLVALLITPVRSNAIFREMMHLVCTYLDFKRN